MLTKEQKLRYNRQLIIPGFTEQDQEKLFQASVLVIGAGGLGSPVLSYLSSAGIGSIGIVDADRVELSNLQRQILYSEKDIGKQKVDIAAERLRAMNSSLHLKTYSSRWDRNLASSIASNYHVLIDCTDNIASRIITDAISVQVGIPFIYGAVNGWEGQLSVFNYRGSKSYSETFNAFNEAISQDHPAIGVMGVGPGIIGTLQAAEAIKVILNHEGVLAGKLLQVSLKTQHFELFEY